MSEDWRKQVEDMGDEDPTDAEIEAAFAKGDPGDEVLDATAAVAPALEEKYYGDTVFNSEEEADAFIRAAMIRMGRPNLMDDKSGEA